MRKSRLPLRSGLTEKEALTVVALLAGTDIEFEVAQTCLLYTSPSPRD